MTDNTAAQPLDLDKLEALAKAARDDIIRSHGWAGTVDGFDALRVDEQYLLAANPATILALIAQARTASASIADDNEFQCLVGDVYCAGSHNESIEKSTNALVAYIDSRASQPVQAGEAVLTLLNHIENVVDDVNWEKIDPKLWNAVTTSFAPVAAQQADIDMVKGALDLCEPEEQQAFQRIIAALKGEHRG